MAFRGFHHWPLVVFLLGVVVFSLLFGGFFSFADPDYFWHYKTGEYIAQNKAVPAHDLFSFSMPDFPWVNHEWLSDAVLYWIESHAGQWWLGVFYLGLFFASIFILTFQKMRTRPVRSLARAKGASPKDLGEGTSNGMNWLDAVIGLIGVVLLFGFVGVRQQTYSILFFIILLSILAQRRAKFLWFLPPFFLIWANLHGGFVLGLAVLAFYVFWETFRQQPIDNGGYRRQLFAVAFASVAVTFINPYGLRIYEEVLRTAGDSFLSRHIAEWQPLIFSPPTLLRFAALFAFILALLPELRKRVAWQQQIFLLILFLASLRSVKYLPYFIIVVLPALWLATDSVMTPAHRQFFRRIITSRQALWPIAAFAIVGILFLKPDIFFKISYPAYPSGEAVGALQKSGGSPSQILQSKTWEGKRILNYYGWGGYLIRYAPERRYFIDGRMPSWRTKDTFAFGDYVDLTSCKRTDEILDKYSFDAVIWPFVQAELKISKWLESKELESLSDKIGEKLWGQKPKCDFIGELVKRGWKEKFNDGNAVILQKP